MTKFTCENQEKTNIKKNKLPHVVWFSFGTVVTPSQARSASQFGEFPAVVLMVLPVHITQADPSR